MNTSRGFVSVGLFIMVIIGLAALGAGGIFLYSQPAKDTTAEKASETTSVPTAPVAPVVERVAWIIEQTYPGITSDDDYRKYFHTIAIDVTFADGSARRYPLGVAPGCNDSDQTISEQEGKKVFGQLRCYFALSGTTLTAYSQNGTFVVEEYTDDPSGLTAGKTDITLRLPEQLTAGSDFRVTPKEGKAPLTVALYVPESAGSTSVYFGDGTSTNDTCQAPEGCDEGGMMLVHTYTKPGVYTLMVSRLLPSTVIATTTIRVQ